MGLMRRLVVTFQFIQSMRFALPQTGGKVACVRVRAYTLGAVLDGSRAPLNCPLEEAAVPTPGRTRRAVR